MMPSRHKILRQALSILVLACVGSLMPVAANGAERHAVLIGVSEYPMVRTRDGGQRVDLRGPRNDVRLMKQVLLQQGFLPSRITVVADGVDAESDAVEPTRANILAAIDQTVARLSRGDFLYLHFSGHGSQQPERMAGQEIDGLDEIFLARDTSRWNPATRSVEGAIVDDEIAQRIAAAEARGATVWSVFDTCHAGSMTRDIGLESRQLSPTDLGVPATVAAGRAPAVPTPRRKLSLDAPPTGDSVAFFATSAHALTPEFRPRILREVHGLFTYVLAEGLRSYPGATYRQLGDFIYQRYGALGAGAAASPLFEGALDAPVFGDGTLARHRQWPVHVDDTSVWIDAGALSMFAEGARFALLSDPRASVSEALAFARATEVRPMSARLVAIDPEGKATSALPTRFKGAFARLVDPNPGFQVRTVVTYAANALRRAPLETVLRELRIPGGHGPRLDWIEDPEDADLELRVTRDRVFLRPRWDPLIETGPTATLSVALPRTGYGVTAYDTVAEDLRTHLQRVARSVNLLRVASQHLSDTEETRFRASILIHRRAQPTPVPLQPGTAPVLSPGDEIHIEAENLGRDAVDVTVLVIDAQHRISMVFPSPGRRDNRLPPRSPPVFLGEGFEITDDTAGVERVVILARRGGPASDFSYLAEDSPSRGASITRGVGTEGSGFDMLDEAMGESPPGTRAITRDNGQRRGQTAIRVFTWRTAPRAQ